MRSDFLELNGRLGSSAGEFWSHFLIYQRKMNHTIYLMKWFAGELPEVNRASPYLYVSDCLLQIAFILIVSRKQVNFPMALAAFTLIQSAAKNLRLNLNSIFQQTGDFASQLSSLRAIYAVSEIKNKVKDGTEGLNTNRDGLSLEFELVTAMARRAPPHGFFFSDVSFKYPGSKSYALRNVSFEVKPGQLCVRRSWLWTNTSYPGAYRSLWGSTALEKARY